MKTTVPEQEDNLKTDYGHGHSAAVLLLTVQ